MKIRKIHIISGLLGLTLLSVSCTKVNRDDDFPPGDVPPVAGGFSTADEVAKDNLVAYWSFDENNNELKTNTAPTIAAVNSSTSTGIKGKAVSLDYGYLAYPEIAGLNSLPSYTITAWINTSNRKGVPERGGAQSIFQLSRRATSTTYEWAGNVTFMMENDWYLPTDPVLVVKGLNVTNVNGNASWQDSRNDPGRANPGVQKFEGGNKWVQVALLWNAKDSLLQVYGNSIKISNPEWEKRSNGNLVFFTPTAPIIGGWGTNSAGVRDSWQQPFKGQIDEVRVYNKALSAIELSALYLLEKDGR